MPALVLFKNFTTRPFGGDDLHIGCLILLFYRLIQFICLSPLCLHYYLQVVRGEDIYVNGVPPWCHQYDASKITLFYDFELQEQPMTYYNDTVFDYQRITSYERNNFPLIFVVLAIIYFGADITWICMVWSASSLGTPTETNQRDVYLRKLIIFKMFIGNMYPLLLLIFGIRKVHRIRSNNYGCGDGPEPEDKPDEGVWFAFFCALLITYALELLVLPAIIANHIMRVLRSSSFLIRSQSTTNDNEQMAERFEQFVGMALRLLQCITCNRTDFQNQGELKEFACHFMELMNYNTKLDIVLSDMYVGLKMLARVQAEEKVKAIKLLSKKNKILQHLLQEEQNENEKKDDSEIQEIPHNQLDGKDHQRHSMQKSMLVLCENDESAFDIYEREVLGTKPTDESLMKAAAHFATYAQIIYSRLKMLVADEFMLRNVAQFTRDLDRLDNRGFNLRNVGCDHAMLFHANFDNGLFSTPYAIIVDEDSELKSIVITVRGTKSLDDMVVDLQYNPTSLEKTGKICGFDGSESFCHSGFLTRAKWLYNDIKKNKVLKALYSEQSPFRDFPLIICGHSLGGGCATLLSIMLRPAFPTLKCFAYCPPGAVVDNIMADYCEEFITSIVKHDDVVPRISHHNFEILRDKFLDVIARIQVPKIELFIDVRNPCLSEVVSRNAKVLRAEKDIPQDTDFYLQVNKFRGERNEKNQLAGSRETNLFIAGKIVHLVDTKGDGTKYMAYWANRCRDFNQIIISDRMKKDHSMIDLVDTLRDIDLRNQHGHSMSIAFQNSLGNNTEADGKDGADIRLFMCCSNPDGKLPLILSMTALVALSLSGASLTLCRFFSRESSYYVNGVEILEIPFSIGFFSYTLLTCADDSICEKVTASTLCVPYPDNTDNWHMQASRSFAFLAILFGGLSFLLLCISTCFPLRRWVWKLIAFLFVMTSLFQGLVFLMLDSDLCKTIVLSEDEVTEEIDSVCHISHGALEAIIAASMHFAIAIASMHFVKSARKQQQNMDVGQ